MDTTVTLTKENKSSLQPIVRLIALYLPQFHPIPENNEWWGTGFTEWTNVAKAKPMFRGHFQPRLPADLGFYDLRLAEVREAQADLARGCGIEGFCYWHYWFGNGRRILERPFNEVLESGRPDFPFCLAWANQPWTGIWHWSPKKVLMEQCYPGKEDEKAHFNALLPAFRDKRYMRVDDKPIFIIYDPHHHPDPKTFMDHWQELAKEAGFPGFYFIAMANYSFPSNKHFDAIMEFGPGDFLATQQTWFKKKLRKLKSRDLGYKLTKILGDNLANKLLLPARYDYKHIIKNVLNGYSDNLFRIPCILPNWDNTPRSGKKGYVVENATPELFRKYLAKALALVTSRPQQKKLVFIKAWNEWAEGNYIEPDAKYGHAYLDVIRSEMFKPEA